MLALPPWLHEALALAGVLIASVWLVLRIAQVGRPRQVGCSRCPQGAGPAPSSSRGVRSKQLRVIA